MSGAGPGAVKPVLIGCSHGTDSVTGRAAIRGLLDQVRLARPELDVREAFVDVQEPRIDEVVAGVDGPAVIVPLLLSTGFHVKQDIIGACIRPDVVAAPPLGPDHEQPPMLHRRAGRSTRTWSVVPKISAHLVRSGPYSLHPRRRRDHGRCRPGISDAVDVIG